MPETSATPATPYERQFFVCTFGPWCRLDGSADVHKALKAKAKEAGLASEVRVTKCGCLGQCGNGPMAVSWPDNVWYAHISVGDVDELFDSHVKRGEPVSRLLYVPKGPGTNKTDAVLEKERDTGKVTE